MSEAPELKCCPFCGGTPRYYRHNDAACADEKCPGFLMRHCPPDLWNRRATPPELRKSEAEMPANILADRDESDDWFGEVFGDWRSGGEGGTPYTRTDLSTAAIAVARAEGLREGLTVASKYITDPGSRLAVDTAIRAISGEPS